jgi:hypothetical protein
MPKVRSFGARLLWTGLMLLIALGLIVGSELALGRGAAASSYVLPAVLIGLTWVLCGLLARLVFSSERDVAGSILLLLVVLPLVDPYSSGRIGGDANLQAIYPWQLYVTIASTCLLLACAILLARNRLRLAPAIVMVELVVFVAANWLYIQRDGLALRGFSGYWGSPFPLLTVVCGALLRPTLLLLLLRASGRSPRHAAPVAV